MRFDLWVKFNIPRSCSTTASRRLYNAAYVSPYIIFARRLRGSRYRNVSTAPINQQRGNMLKSYPTRYPTREAGTRVIRLTVDQEAVLQEQFNRWPRAPHTADVVLLAAETGLSEADVEGWYAIRLAQWRKEQGLGGNLGLH